MNSTPTAACSPFDPRAIRVLGVVFALCSAAASAVVAAPLALYLTWQNDPATTQVVHWHTDASAADSLIEYRAVGDTRWLAATGWSRPWPDTPRRVHMVELRGLSPGTDHEFRLVGLGDTIERFRTLPATLDAPLRFAVGGDLMGRRAAFEQMSRVVAGRDPAFAVVGGDWAYADGLPEKVQRWFDLWDVWNQTMRAPDGRLIPLVAAIGNHEVRGGRGASTRDAPYYYRQFAFPAEPGYGVLDFGDYLSLVILDTDHATRIVGAQTTWLAQQLSARAGRPHVFPVYHVPAYPSVRPFEGRASTAVREHWVPLFERHGVRLAFEHHDHAYKRTHPMRAGEASTDGIVYVGDGAWGVGLREPDLARPYLARAAARHHVVLVTLDGPRRLLEVVTKEGDVIDTFSVPAD